MKEKVTKPLI